MEKIQQVALNTALSMADQAAHDTGAFAAHVFCNVVEGKTGLVYAIEIVETGDSVQLACSETSLEVLTEKLAECVAHSYEWQDSNAKEGMQ